jgi:hypothetical protein
MFLNDAPVTARHSVFYTHYCVTAFPGQGVE